MSTMTGDMISVTIGQLLEGLIGMNGIFVETGFVFLSLAVILSVVGGIYNWWTSGTMLDLVGNGVRTLILLVPLVMLLSGWSGYMNTFTSFFYKDLPSAIGATGGTASDVAGEAVKQIMGAVSFEVPPPKKESADGVLETLKVWWERAGEAISLANYFTLILKTISFLLNALLIFAILFALFMPVASLMIGAIFGPLLLPWLLWKPLSGMTERWTGFMIANGISFVVAIVILKALAKTLKAMTTQMQTMANDGLLTGLLGMSVTLVALFAIYIFAANLMLAANEIAEGMTGGAAIGEGLVGKSAASLAGGGMLRTGGAAKNLGIQMGKAASKAASKLLPGSDKIGNVLNKAGNAIKEHAVYKELDKPIKPIK